MTTSSPTVAPRLREHLALSVGAVAMVTLAAFADRAVGTALPTVVRDFDALASFGLANAAPAASFLVALAVAGAWADRRGPLPVLRTGVAAFAAAQLLVGLAWAMPVVVVGRLVSGAGEALVDVSLLVLVARVLPSQLRPRMFSLVSAAWVLPSVVGPVVTGVVTEQLGWRWVFLGVLVLVGPTWLLLRPALGVGARGSRRRPPRASRAPDSAGPLLAGGGRARAHAGRGAPVRRRSGRLARARPVRGAAVRQRRPAAARRHPARRERACRPWSRCGAW